MNKNKRLKIHLDRLYRTFNRSYLATDPLELVHGFSRSEDREIVGLIASSLAYGKVQGIKRSVKGVLDIMGPDPYGFTMRFRPGKESRLFSGFVHRFNRGEDISCLLYFIRQMFEECGSIGNFFLKDYSPGDGSMKRSLTAFTANVLALDTASIYGGKELPRDAGVRFFFPSPEAGSACKRLNLYLRWMVRRGDSLDFGLWREVDPGGLIIPLDTHIARISRNIGLTRRATPDWKMAEEITAELKKLDPADPLKYDFAICRLGIMDRCPKRVDLRKCGKCLIKELCTL
jgi:uncharacterized protein (TIGR02757 family)